MVLNFKSTSAKITRHYLHTFVKHSERNYPIVFELACHLHIYLNLVQYPILDYTLFCKMLGKRISYGQIFLNVLRYSWLIRKQPHRNYCEKQIFDKDK